MEFHETPQHQKVPIRAHKLTPKQERNLVDYLEDKFLDLTRNYKKRHHPSSTLPTLNSYLEATSPLLSIILQIPPVALPQISLRTALLLRFTGDFLSSITGYDVPSDTETFSELLNCLSVLDVGWVVVLRRQVWDPEGHEGIELEVPITQDQSNVSAMALDDDTTIINDSSASNFNSTQLSPTPTYLHPSSIVTQTDRTRLRSMIMTFSTALEEWLENGLHVDGATDLESALERLGLEQRFDEMFVGSLREMGELAGDEAELLDT